MGTKKRMIGKGKLKPFMKKMLLVLKTMKAPVFVYFQLCNFYGSHRRDFMKATGLGGKGTLPLEGTPTVVKTEPGKMDIGHLGYIELPVPIYRPSHITKLKRILSLICLKCLEFKNQKVLIYRFSLLIGVSLLR
ncbi:Aspartate decarboxylase-like domain-containing protein [Artemisia annua]|uniref:Aspartate decarboxylase-like domain-containing protein n=1 Tax=Artemisia annua TaxID=35608 RepID=A0A2U1N1J3_ARTAN|nr:Aspartate decarboxylase-like domain-containing protein [Artemisia annua]